jgi:nucleoside 2-deoxyribosyltransferase
MEQKRKMLIYFAGPLFSEAEKQFNLRLGERLEEAGFCVFLPQRDGVEGTKPPYDRMDREERRRAMK